MKKQIKRFTTYRLVKSEDLNHHGTLFAGRGAEWFVESGFVAAAQLLPPQNLICVKIHGLNFQQPVRVGETVCYTSCIVNAGKSSLTAYVKVCKNNCNDVVVDGFATFVHVDANTKAIPHGIELEATNEEDLKLMETAVQIKLQK
jgi:acyl-CoA hydrolase